MSALRIAIIDADLLGRRRHRFPNLACMKISGYHKDAGDDVELVTCYDNMGFYNHIYLSKVFTDTPVPDTVLSLPNISCGGTGFYYDTAPRLPDEIEHHMPDYHLYDAWVEEQIRKGMKPSEFSYYTDYSIGFLTRGCFRKCQFCVNRNYDRVHQHSPLAEFYDPARKKICLLDDNFFGHPAWKEMLKELKATGRPFQFKQGLDERLLTDEKCRELFGSRYDGDYIFAFDNIADAALIEEKLKLIRQHTNAIPKFYCFTGFDRTGAWDGDFWKRDIFDLFSRIELMMKYRCLPYVMRYARYKESPYRGVYITVARWCNQPSFFKKKSLREFSQMESNKTAARYLRDFETLFPEAAFFMT
jgi:hypothetical protein